MFLAVNIEHTFPVFIFANGYCCVIIAVAQHYLIVCLCVILPYLTIIYGIVFEESNNPVASIYVTPVGFYDICGIRNVEELEITISITLNKIKAIRLGR